MKINKVFNNKDLNKIEKLVSKSLIEHQKVKLNYEYINEQEYYDFYDNLIGVENVKYSIVFDFDYNIYQYYRKNKQESSYHSKDKYDLFNCFFEQLFNIIMNDNLILTDINIIKEKEN